MKTYLSEKECLEVLDRYLEELSRKERTHKIQNEIRSWLPVRRLILNNLQAERRGVLR
jgi:hypothetical protein